MRRRVRRRSVGPKRPPAHAGRGRCRRPGLRVMWWSCRHVSQPIGGAGIREIGTTAAARARDRFKNARARRSVRSLQTPPASFRAAGPRSVGRTQPVATVATNAPEEILPMFFHDKRLQYNAKPDRPDPLYAKKLQEVLGGQWGEISVFMMYLFQGWNCRGPSKYRDMLLDIGTEEIAHVEMLSTMICRLLEGATADHQEAAGKSNSVVGAILGGTNPKDAIIAAAANPQHWIV